MSNDSTRKTIGVALGVCLVCSILVSTAAVTLKTLQEENKKLEKLKNILIAGDLYSSDRDIENTYNSKILPSIISLESGMEIPKNQYDDILNIENFDIKTVANNPQYRKSIPAERDLAQIKIMPQFMAVYLVKIEDEVEKVILPIYGKGLWSTMYGFISLNKDLRTITGFTFYDHGETPGLGGEVDNPSWKRLWQGKLAFDENWDVKIQVIKGKVDNSKQEAKYQVDGLSGSTLTTRGVDHTVRFWLGEDGYGPFLKKLREDGING